MRIPHFTFQQKPLAQKDVLMKAPTREFSLQNAQSAGVVSLGAVGTG